MGVGEVEREMVKVASPVMGLEFSLPSLARREPGLGTIVVGGVVRQRSGRLRVQAERRKGGEAVRRKGSGKMS